MVTAAKPRRRIVVHGTTVALGRVGVLIRGRSGAGKSDLALRLIDEGARLVADDLTQLDLARGGLRASVPETVPARLLGRIEVRGLGIFAVPRRPSARLGLVVDLRPGGVFERLPAPSHWRCLGRAVPLIVLDPASPSAAAKVRLAARVRRRSIIPLP